MHDPIASPQAAMEHYGIELKSWDELPRADALIVAVPHAQVLARPLEDFTAKLSGAACSINVKSRFPADEFKKRGADVWRL